jgi:uncharacterized membrane protein
MAGLDGILSGVEMQSLDAGGDGFGTSNKDLMAEARGSLKGNWGMAVLGYLLFFFLLMSLYAFVASAAFFVSITGSKGGPDGAAVGSAINLAVLLVKLLVSGAFVVGFCAFFLGIVQENEARMELLFLGFRRFWKSFACYFFVGLFVFLWSLLLVIPGIIAAFRYSMAYFIIADDEDCGPLEAISRSKEMMKSNKWKLFCLHWRFFGWALFATVFTFGIGYLWLIPYMQTSFVKFYEDVN